MDPQEMNCYNVSRRFSKPVYVCYLFTKQQILYPSKLKEFDNFKFNKIMGSSPWG